MKSSPRGSARFTLLFLLFIAVFSIFSLLMKHIMVLLFPMFGLALGLWRKGGHVNVGIRITLMIFSIGAVVFLALFSIIIFLVALLFLFLLAGAPQVLLLVPIGYSANLLRKGRPSNAKIRKVLLIFSIGATAYLAWWLWGNIHVIPTFIFFSFAVLPFLLPVLLVVIGYFAGVRSLSDKKSEPQDRTVGETVSIDRSLMLQPKRDYRTSLKLELLCLVLLDKNVER